MHGFVCSVFHVFHDGKWIGKENFLAYVNLLFEARLTIYRSSLYVKMDARYKRKTPGLKKKEKEKEKEIVEFIGNF